MAIETSQHPLEIVGLHQKGEEVFNKVMEQILDLGQVSLPESQFIIFKKLVLHYFTDGKFCFSKMAVSDFLDRGNNHREIVKIKI